MRKIPRGRTVAQLRKLIKSRSWKQKELAELWGHSEPWVSTVLAGKQSIRTSDIEALVVAAGITMADFYALEERAA